MSGYVVTLEEAAEFCHHHATVRHADPCRSGCLWLSVSMAADYAVYGAFMDPRYPRPEPEEDRQVALDRLVDHGWEQLPGHHAYVLRCVPCRVPEYPWIAALDRERVQAWLQREYDKSDAAPFLIDFEDLRRSCS